MNNNLLVHRAGTPAQSCSPSNPNYSASSIRRSPHCPAWSVNIAYCRPPYYFRPSSSSSNPHLPHHHPRLRSTDGVHPFHRNHCDCHCWSHCCWLHCCSRRPSTKHWPAKTAMWTSATIRASKIGSLHKRIGDYSDACHHIRYAFFILYKIFIVCVISTYRYSPLLVVIFFLNFLNTKREIIRFQVMHHKSTSIACTPSLFLYAHVRCCPIGQNSYQPRRIFSCTYDSNPPPPPHALSISLFV